MDICTPIAIPFLQAQRLDSSIACRQHAKWLPCLPQGIPSLEAVLHWCVNLPAELTHVGYTQRQYRNIANRHILRCQVRESFVREIVFTHQLHQLASKWSPYTDAATTGCNVVHIDRTISGYLATDPREIVVAKSGAGDDLESIGSQAGYGQVAFDAAMLIWHLSIGDGTYRLVHLIVSNVLQKGQ